MSPGEGYGGSCLHFISAGRAYSYDNIHFTQGVPSPRDWAEFICPCRTKQCVEKTPNLEKQLVKSDSIDALFQLCKNQ
jgi:hypothetical protein